MFNVLTNKGNEGILEEFVTNCPDNFGELVKASTDGKLGWSGIGQLGCLTEADFEPGRDEQSYGLKEKDIVGRHVCEPSVQNWINEHEKIYGEAFQQALDGVVENNYSNKEGVVILLRLANQRFLKKHPTVLNNIKEKYGVSYDVPNIKETAKVSKQNINPLLSARSQNTNS